jgi:hypothetical protein
MVLSKIRGTAPVAYYEGCSAWAWSPYSRAARADLACGADRIRRVATAKPAHIWWRRRGIAAGGYSRIFRPSAVPSRGKVHLGKRSERVRPGAGPAGRCSRRSSVFPRWRTRIRVVFPPVGGPSCNLVPPGVQGSLISPSRRPLARLGPPALTRQLIC